MRAPRFAPGHCAPPSAGSGTKSPRPKAPVALVSLVDGDRHWFKSCFGLSANETSHDIAFCAQVVHQKDEMVVPDTLQDDRFADNFLAPGEARIRFYAGVPLLLEDGTCGGTFCIADTRPREL